MNDLFSIESPPLREALFLLKQEICERERRKERDEALLTMRAVEAATLLFGQFYPPDAEESSIELLPDALREHYAVFLQTLGDRAADACRGILCHTLAAFLEQKRPAYCRLPSSLPAHPRVCYLRNRFSDDAYDLLSPALLSPLARYADSFDQVAEQLAGENCDAILLPYETGEGGVLRGVESILSAYDFKKSAVCVLREGTSFALLLPYLTAASSARYIEIELPGGGDSVADLMRYLPLCGGKLLRLRYRDGQNARLTVEGDRLTFTSLRVYLGLHHPHYTCGGFYTRLYENDEEEY